MLVIIILKHLLGGSDFFTIEELQTLIPSFVSLKDTTVQKSERSVLNNNFISPAYTVCLDPQCPFLFTSINLLINNKDDLSFIKKSDKTIFSEPLKQRTEITHYTFNKSGIYCWINKINGNFYIGSGIKLNNRINDYFQKAYLLKKENLIIVRGIKHYGLENFELIILEDFSAAESSSIEQILEREQYWINLLNPIYNILTIAGNSLGFKHTEETKELIKLKSLGRRHTDETRKLMSESRKGENSIWYGKNLSEETRNKLSIIALNRTKDHNPGFKLQVLDLENNNNYEFKSIREASRVLKIDYARFSIYIKNKETYPYKRRYLVTVLETNSNNKKEK